MSYQEEPTTVTPRTYTEEQRARKRTTAQARRERRKAARLCIQCGEQDYRTLEGACYCSACRDRKKQSTDRFSMYPLLREKQLCVRCRKQDAYTLAGRAYCAECTEARNARRREIADENREKVNATAAERYQRQKADGVCIDCGKPLDRKGVRCRRCNLKNNRKKVERNRERTGINWPRGDNGICWQCNKEPAMAGKRLCRACQEKATRQLMECAVPRVSEYNAYMKRNLNPQKVRDGENHGLEVHR